MTKENFAEELRNRLPEYMPDRYKNLTFSEKKTNKNNGVELTGILVDDGSGCAPAIYIDKMYDNFCDKPDFEKIIRNLAKTIVDVMDSKPDTDNILKKIKEGFTHVIPKLINAEKNQELLKNCPHRFLLLPGVALNKLEPFLQKRKIEYSVTSFGKEDYKDDWGIYWKYGKLSGYHNTVAVISYIDSDCLLKIAEELRNIDDSEI